MSMKNANNGDELINLLYTGNVVPLLIGSN